MTIQNISYWKGSICTLAILEKSGKKRSWQNWKIWQKTPRSQVVKSFRKALLIRPKQRAPSCRLKKWCLEWSAAIVASLEYWKIHKVCPSWFCKVNIVKQLSSCRFCSMIRWTLWRLRKSRITFAIEHWFLPHKRIWNFCRCVTSISWMERSVWHQRCSHSCIQYMVNIYRTYCFSTNYIELLMIGRDRAR